VFLTRRLKIVPTESIGSCKKKVEINEEESVQQDRDFPGLESRSDHQQQLLRPEEQI
jgi:hypothetical protein